MQVPYAIEMGKVLGIDNWFSLGAICFSHPLRFDKEVADRFVIAAKRGHSIGLTGMEVAGATTPITVAGFVAVSAAEYIATWIAGRAINPAVPLGGSLWAATLDMRGGDASYSAPDAMLRAFALNEFLRRWCGRAVHVGGGEYSSTKAVGLYASLEKAYKALLIAAYTGQHPPVGQGMVEQGRAISLVQLLLDWEMTTALESLTQPVVVDDETIALDTILEVGYGLESSYLTTDHTRRHYRATTWLAPFSDRSGYRGCQTEEEAMAKAKAKIQEMLAQYVSRRRTRPCWRNCAASSTGRGRNCCSLTRYLRSAIRGWLAPISLPRQAVLPAHSGQRRRYTSLPQSTSSFRRKQPPPRKRPPASRWAAKARCMPVSRGRRERSSSTTVLFFSSKP